MSKILYVVKYMPDDYNSVGDILNRLLDVTEMKNQEQIVAQCDGHSFSHINISTVNNYKCYSADILSIKEIFSGNEIKLSEKVMLTLKKMKLYLLQKIGKSHCYLENSNAEYLENIIKKEKPQLVMFFVYSPEMKFVDICKKNQVDYVYMLYDTFLARPGTDKKKATALERTVVDNSKVYFVPAFFADEYFKTFGKEKIVSFNLPLLIEKNDIENAYRNKRGFEFTYFGQIQNFRNGEKIRNIFSQLNKRLDVFTSSNDCTSDENFIIHNSLTKDELFTTVAGSKFLVAFDNSAPYNMYLPSKAYLYVSFTKPIIVFGDNEESALKSFLKDYPMWYYQNINEPLDGLIEFISKNQYSQFDEKIYSDFIDYLPENALKEYSEIINNLLQN